MLHTISSIVGIGAVVGTAIGTILKGFYKTNSDANNDYKIIETRFDNKLEKLEQRLEHEFENNDKDIKEELKNISDKIDNMKNRYVTNENFKTYVDSISQLLKMSNDRMTRIEEMLDDIRDDINTVVRTHINIKDVNA